MCLCACMFVCMHVCVTVCMCVCLRACMCVHVCVSSHVFIHICMWVNLSSTFFNVNNIAYKHKCVCRHVHACAYMFVCVHIYNSQPSVLSVNNLNKQHYSRLEIKKRISSHANNDTSF